jgi:hypothetical protein
VHPKSVKRVLFSKSVIKSKAGLKTLYRGGDMDISLKERFITRWEKYFGGAALPIAFYYSAGAGDTELVKPSSAGHRCVLADVYPVQAGRSLAFDNTSLGCFGGKRYLGFSSTIMPNFEYFLSCGIPGELEGERYKKSPDLVKEYLKLLPSWQAPKDFIVFKRWDKLDASDEPDVVIFFATADILSGLFTLANFDEPGLNGVYAPFGAGCATTVLYPFMEKASARPRAVIGMFDVSARPCVPANTLSFAVAMNRFMVMVDNMDESFLTTGSWEMVKKRIALSLRKRQSGDAAE